MNNNNEILAYVRHRMAEMGYPEGTYTTNWLTQLKVATSSTERINASSDILFLTNVYQADGIELNGTIVAEDNADQLSPLFLNQNFAQVQIYRGEINITNNSADGNLYVEFIECSPLI